MKRTRKLKRVRLVDGGLRYYTSSDIALKNHAFNEIAEISDTTAVIEIDDQTAINAGAKVTEKENA